MSTTQQRLNELRSELVHVYDLQADPKLTAKAARKLEKRERRIAKEIIALVSAQA